MIMPGIDEKDLLSRCDDIRNKTKLLKIEHRGQMLGTITISIGAALFPMHGETPESLISAADVAMYVAKHKGRDQVILGQKSPSASRMP